MIFYILFPELRISSLALCSGVGVGGVYYKFSLDNFKVYFSLDNFIISS